MKKESWHENHHFLSPQLISIHSGALVHVRYRSAIRQPHTSFINLAINLMVLYASGVTLDNTRVSPPLLKGGCTSPEVVKDPPCT